MKGVIVAAGYGTRFLPVTRTVPKEMLPLIDVPAIELVVQEFIESGIRDILIITSRRKKILEDYFDRQPELETALSGNEGKLAKLKPMDANFCFVRQQTPSGAGAALLLARPFVGDEPFVVAYPDDVFSGKVPLAKELIEAYEKSGKTVLTVLEVPEAQCARYGIIDPGEKTGGLVEVKSLVEKPPRGTEPSNLASMGRYLYTSEIFDVVEELLPQYEGRELYQTPPINVLAARGKVAALLYHGLRFDLGEPAGFLRTLTVSGLKREDIGGAYLSFLRQVIHILDDRSSGEDDQWERIAKLI